MLLGMTLHQKKPSTIPGLSSCSHTLAHCMGGTKWKRQRNPNNIAAESDVWLWDRQEQG